WPSSIRAAAIPCWACGRTARPWPLATPARTCGSWYCTASSRRAPPWPRAPPARWARWPSASASPAGRPATDWRSPTSPTSLRRESAPTRPGAPGRRHRSRWRCAVWRARSPSRSSPFEIAHAHNAVPAGEAVRRARTRTPVIVSVHGGDVLYTAGRGQAGAQAVRGGLSAAQLVLENSEGIAEMARQHGARRTRVVHLGADLPAAAATTRRTGPPSLVTVAHLVARKRHADVLRALVVLRPRHPRLLYSIVGEGPERTALEGLAARRGSPIASTSTGSWI